MKRLLPILLLITVQIKAQEVKSILSKAYLERIAKDTLPAWKRAKDSVISTPFTYYDSVFNADNVLHPGAGPSLAARIISRGHGLKVMPVKRRTILLGGSVSSSVVIRQVNRSPALQNEYAQGRAENGSIIWRGPETGELFSYGPALSSLEFDNSSYPYDVHGRLVERGNGSGQKAMAYKNDLFRTSSVFTQAMVLRGRYSYGGVKTLSGTIKLGQETEKTVMLYNRNRKESISSSLEWQFDKMHVLAGSYKLDQSHSSNTNRTGFLNRAYQQSLLTPVSFDNAQGVVLNNAQRSYSVLADNPLFLLQDNGNSFTSCQQNGQLSFERKYWKNISYKIQGAIEKMNNNGLEGYKSGAVSFPNGIAIDRNQEWMNVFLRANATYEFTYPGRTFRSTAGLNITSNSHRNTIHYSPGNSYRYDRLSHDLALNYQTVFTGSLMDAGLNLVNKVYASNTTAYNAFFLPSVGGFVTMDELMGSSDWYFKVSGNYAVFNSELSLDNSFGRNYLLHYRTDQSLQYFPVQEPTGYDGLGPIRHKEWTANVELEYKRAIVLRVNLFNRHTTDDVSPIFNGNELQLQNMVDHRNRGLEIYLGLNSIAWNAKKITYNSSVSFFRYNNIVTGLKYGYDTLAIGGFADVHKVAVAGQPLGAIAGSRYLRDADQRLVIGQDGFPLVEPTRGIVGNPIPDFVIKTSHQFTWKAVSFNIDIEWKKGGQVWNGTQAVLDYYGRSKSSGLLRNTTGYVFAGVRQDGHKNDVPVSFYDPSLPVENNRWTRYGYSGVTESYMQRGDYIRINNLSLGYQVKIKRYRQNLSITGYAQNILLWTPYKGADPGQLLFDQWQTEGMDYFNLPSTRSYGLTVSLQF